MKRICTILCSALALVVASNTETIAQQSYTDGHFKNNDVSLFYKIYGNSGEYVIILAGGPGSEVNYMQPCADSLSKYYQCVMLEQRGTGRSMLKKYDTSTIRMDLYVEDIEALRKHLKTESLILFDNSWGSLPSLLYGIYYPSRVNKIITVGSGLVAREYAEIFNDNMRVRLLPHEKEIRDLWRPKLRNPETFVRANYERDKAGMPAYYFNREIGLKASMELKPDDFNYYVFPAFLKSHPSFDLRPSLSKITADVLLVQGRQDLCGDANIIETKMGIKRSTLKFIEQCGHIPWEEKPAETWSIIYSWLKIR